MFLMIFQSLISPRKSRCDVLNGNTQGHDYPPPNFKFQTIFHSRVPIETFHVSKNVFFITLTTFMWLKGVFVIMLRYLK
jgi:hypothetical protein